jgi:hypothetical protein
VHNQNILLALSASWLEGLTAGLVAVFQHTRLEVRALNNIIWTDGPGRLTNVENWPADKHRITS